MSCVTLKFQGWPWTGHVVYDTSSFVHNFIAICEVRTGVSVQKSPNLVKISFELFDLAFDLWPWLFVRTSLLSMIITSENFMMIRWHKQRKSCDGQKDGWTEPFIELLGRSLKKQGQSEGFDSCDRPSNINQVGFKSTIFWPRMIFKFDGWPKKK